MPFDSAPLPSVSPALSPEHRRLLAIAEMLETDRDIRRGWNFELVGGEQSCGYVGCAIGWAEYRGIVHYDDDLNARLGVPWRTLDAIFGFGGTGLYGKSYADVTPDDVAARIRAHLATLYPALRQAAGER